MNTESPWRNPQGHQYFGSLKTSSPSQIDVEKKRKLDDAIERIKLKREMKEIWE